jgi:methyl-accepting chemotaxis protein
MAPTERSGRGISLATAPKERRGRSPAVPWSEMLSALAAFRAGDHSQRLPEPAQPAELGALCRAVNLVLVHTAADRERMAAESLELAMGVSEHLATLAHAERGELSVRASESSSLELMSRLGGSLNGLLGTLQNLLRKEQADADYAHERTLHILEVLDRSTRGEDGVRATASRDDEMGRLAGGVNATLDAKEQAMEQAHSTMLEVGIAVSEFLATLQEATRGNLAARTQEQFANEALSTLGKMINRLLVALEDITRDIGEASHRVDSAAVELLSAAQQQSKANSEQAAALTQNASAIEELAIAAKEIERRAHEVFGNARQNVDLAGRSYDAVTASSRAIEQIGTSTSEAAKCIAALGEKSMAITEVTELIDGIASQTNLLALNAAIEAARAGEAGRGFSVVAVEIRKLAENVVESTKEIKRLIKEIQDSTSASVLATERVAKEVERGAEHSKVVAASLERMQETLKTTSESAQGIQVSTSQQTAATDEMTKIVQEFTSFSQEAAKAARESFESAEELTRLASGLRKSAETLRGSDRRGG